MTGIVSHHGLLLQATTPPLFPFIYVKLLCHCDVSPFVDNSLSARTISANSSGTGTSSTQSKFGGVSAVFANTGNQLTVVRSADFEPTGDFTLETWFWTPVAATGQDRCLFTKTTASGHRAFSLEIGVTGKMNARASNAAGTAIVVDIDGTTVVPTSVWNHTAFVRSGDTWTLYLNGVAEASGTLSGPAYSNAAHDLWIGNHSDRARPFYSTGPCYMDEFRFINGYALYTGSTYTVPTSAFPNS